MKIEDGSRSSHLNNDIAIIGMSCRFPGETNSPRAFWNFLLAGGDGIVQIPADRWDHSAYHDADKEKPNKMYVNRGGFIRNIDQFDPQFFGISPKEAPHIDPQHRWLLELAYEALENAGLKAGELKGSDTAVYIGQFMHDYEQLQLDSAARKLMSSHTATGPSMTLTANRISYAFDFTGPSVTLDTACSSSLVALDMACKALQNGDSKLAIAGGVNILLRPELTMSICKASMLSPDGRCKSFDASANGYVRSEGAGLVLVKKRIDAERDGDNILAIIKATGVNQDGQTIGITVPNGESQKKLLRQTLSRSDIAPRDVQYAEAHGTGTAVGDPIEVNALGETLSDRDPGMPCVIGSVKSNVGHMEAAAGVAGLIKTVMAMNEGVIPKNIHFRTLNPAIDVEALNVRIADEPLPWPDTQGKPRRAVVNSFGFGGTNANVVLEQAPPRDKPGIDQKPVVNSDTKLLLISSKTEKGLKDQASKYLEYFQSNQPADLHDICYTAAVKREHHKCRLAVSGADNGTIVQGLQDFVAGNPGTHFVQSAAQTGLDKQIAFVFSGMGPQWAGMGRELYDAEPVFRSMMDKCSSALQHYTGWSLIDAIFNTDDSERIHATYIAQPAIFAIQVSLAELLKTWGIVPACVVGHSAGEVGAAFVAGALDFDDAIKVIYHRSRLQHTTEGTGKMLAVGITEAALRPYLAGVESKISIAAINSEQALTLAGDEQILTSIAERLDEQGLFARFLNVGVPYHSPIMDQLKAPLIEALNDIKVNEPVVPLYSTVTAQRTRDGDWGPEYWADNVREPVLFKTTIEAIAGEGVSAFLEIAPHPVLSSSIEKNLDKAGKKIVTASTLKRGQDDVAMLARTLASLHVAGIPIDWPLLYPNNGRLVYLPNYAWQHAGYWWESEEVQQSRLKNLSRRGGFSEPVHPLLGGRLNSPSAIWQKTLDLQEQGYLADHQVEGEIVYPGAAYVEMALALADVQGKGAQVTLENVEFKRAFFLDKEKPTVLESKVDERDGHFQISAVDSQTGQWGIVSEGVISDITRQSSNGVVHLSELTGKLPLKLEKDDFYRHCHKLGLTYQENFQPVEAAWHGETESVVEISLPSSLADSVDSYLLHPVILDGAFQSLFPTIAKGYLPVKMAEINYYRKPGARCFCHFRTVYKDDSRIIGNLTLFDADGNVLVEVVGGELKSTQTQTGAESSKDSILYDFNWLPQPLTEPESGSVESQNGQWLIFADSRGVGQRLAVELEKRAQAVCIIRQGEAFDQTGEHRFTAGANSSGDIVNIINRYAKSSRGIVYLWGLESQDCENANAETVLADCGLTTITPVYLAQALDKVEWQHKQSVYLISQSVFRLDGDTALPRPIQGALWGFGRVFASEHPEYRVSMVDLAAQVDESIVAQLADNVIDDAYEQEIALRPFGRYVNRLRAINDSQLNDYAWIEVEYMGDRPFQVVRNSKSGGGADRWALKTFSLPEPAADEVVLKVDYAAVNRHSLETILKLNAEVDTDGARREFHGFECTGTVIGLGGNVSRFVVGDQVIAFAKEGLSSVARANSITVVRKPERLSSEQAASIPGAFLAAHYSLNYLARMQEGEAVLIHEAADDIGLAAVQLARLKKARVYATAGTEEQRAYLNTLGLEGVFDSTTFEFARQIASLFEGEGGRGIDIALNVLPGQFVNKTLALINPFGRFIELGGNAAGPGAALPEKLAERSISYQAVDVANLVGRRIGLCGELLQEIIDMFDGGLLSPLPVTPLPVNAMDKAVAGWNEGSRSRKVALAFTVPDVKVVQGLDHDVIKPGRSYLVTGGLGGLGLEIMNWLAEKGAQSIVLIGRSAPSEEAGRKIDAVRGMGVDVVTLRADVTDAGDVAKVVETIEKGRHPLAGIIHSAGVLDDGTIMLQTPEKFNKVLAPKVKGAWNLHQLTQHIELDFFVCFSSIASIVGWAGQSNYASANAFMDTLAFHRRALGKPALTINWGPWGGSGMAASLDARDIQRMKDAGMEALSPEQGLAAMSRLLAYKVPQAGVFDLNWSLIARQYPDPAQKTLFKDFMGESQTGATLDLMEQLKSAPADQRESILEDNIRRILADVLGIDAPESIDSSSNIFEYGMNSLMSMDFKNRLQSMLKSKLPATFALKYPTVRAMAKYVVSDVLGKVISGEAALEEDVLLWDPSDPNKVFDCEVNGSLPFTLSVLHWFKQGKSTHFNIGFMVEFGSARFDLDTLKTSLRILFTYHDGCRLQIFPGEEGLTQEIVPLGDNLNIEEHDFRGLGYEEGVARMRAINERLHKSFTFSKGDPLFRVGYYQLDDANPHRLFLIFHHYLCDALSLKIIASDLESTYVKVFNKEPVYFQPKRDSLIDWTKKLHAFAHNEAVEQVPYWLTVLEKSRLCLIPRDLKVDRTRRKRNYTLVSTAIDRNDYRRLADLCAGQRFEVTDLAIYALTKVFSKLTLAESLWVDLVIHARANVFDDFEVQNVFGQISESASILFELDPELALFDQLNAIREQRVGVPTGGLGLKALRYINKDADIQRQLGADEAPQVLLNFDLINYESESARDWFARAKEGIGEADPPVVEDDYPREFYITGTLKDGGLSIVFMYHQESFYPDTVQAIVEEMQSTLVRLAKQEKPGSLKSSLNEVLS